MQIALFEQALEGALWAEFGLEFWKTVEAKKASIVVPIVEHSRGGEGLTQLIVAVDDMMERMRPSSQ